MELNLKYPLKGEKNMKPIQIDAHVTEYGFKLYYNNKEIYTAHNNKNDIHQYSQPGSLNALSKQELIGRAKQTIIDIKSYLGG